MWKSGKVEPIKYEPGSACGICLMKVGYDLPVAEMAEGVAFWRHESCKARDAQAPCTLYGGALRSQ